MKVRIKRISEDDVKTKEKISYALTNTGQTMIYALFTVYLMLYMTDYLNIEAGIVGIILFIARIFDAVNDPIMGQILDKTNTKWGKCRPYMLFTPIPIALITLLMFAPFEFSVSGAIVYATIVYIIFTMIYTANDIPYWSMSSVITSQPHVRAKIVTMTRIIGGIGSALTIGAFWTVNKFAAEAGANKRLSFFIAVSLFVIVGVILMMQGFFNTKERAKNTGKGEKLFDNLKLVPKSKPLVINLIAGVLVSITAVGTSAMTTYFVKWNIKEIFPNMVSNDIMSIFTPIIGVLPAIATVAGLLAVPKLIRKFEKRDLLIVSSILGVIANILAYFAGYSNIYVFIVFRFIAFLPMGIWSGITTIMIGDSVDDIEYRTGKRVEGTCFSLLTFIGKFQNGANVAITGLLLSAVGYVGSLDPNTQQQSPETLKVIFIMVTLVSALGFLLTAIPFLFYDFDKAKHRFILNEIKERNLLLDNNISEVEESK